MRARFKRKYLQTAVFLFIFIKTYATNKGLSKKIKHISRVKNKYINYRTNNEKF